jgi:hypothetical protein
LQQAVLAACCTSSHSNFRFPCHRTRIFVALSHSGYSSSTIMQGLMPVPCSRLSSPPAVPLLTLISDFLVSSYTHIRSPQSLWLQFISLRLQTVERCRPQLVTG